MRNFMFTIVLVFSFLGGGYLNGPVLAATDSLTYTGNLTDNEMHKYSIDVGQEGPLSVSIVNGDVEYQFTSEADGQSYRDEDTVPVGSYKLSVSTASEDTTLYEINIGGDSLTGNNHLPNLTVEEPTKDFSRLSKGTLDINVSGYSDAYQNFFKLNHQEPVSIANNFSFNTDLLIGPNNLTFSGVTESGNEIFNLKEVTSIGLKRISGSTRYKSAVAISKEIEKEGFDIDTVVITNAYSFVDGVYSVPLAVKNKAPILHTHEDKLNSAVVDEINRLGASKAIIVGGTGAVSDSVKDELIAMGLSVERLSGINREATSVAVAERLIDNNSSNAIIVNGSSEPDGISIASFAGSRGIPILYTLENRLPDEIKAFLNDNSNLTNFTIIGGTGAVSTDVEDELNNFGTVRRVSGSDRYKTGIQIAKAFDWKPRSYVISNNFVDGVPGSVFAALKGSHNFLTKTDSIPESIDNYLTGEGNARFLDNIYIVGGTGAVSEAVEQKLEEKIKNN